MVRTLTLALIAALSLTSAAGCVVVAKGGAGQSADDSLAAQGWEKLGEAHVNGKSDKDTIAVSREGGEFSKIILVVERSDLKMGDIEIEFRDGSTYSPATRTEFDKNSRSAPIDLPGRKSIKNVKLKYSNTGGDGNAKVEIWGK